MCKPGRLSFAALLLIGLTAPAAGLALPDLLAGRPGSDTLTPIPVQGCCRTCHKARLAATVASRVTRPATPVAAAPATADAPALRRTLVPLDGDHLDAAVVADEA
jgi:hypothetical protein